jgi:hypothetical protein
MNRRTIAGAALVASFASVGAFVPAQASATASKTNKGTDHRKPAADSEVEIGCQNPVKVCVDYVYTETRTLPEGGNAVIVKCDANSKVISGETLNYCTPPKAPAL